MKSKNHVILCSYGDTAFCFYCEPKERLFFGKAQSGDFSRKISQKTFTRSGVFDLIAFFVALFSTPGFRKEASL